MNMCEDSTVEEPLTIFRFYTFKLSFVQRGNAPRTKREKKNFQECEEFGNMSYIFKLSSVAAGEHKQVSATSKAKQTHCQHDTVKKKNLIHKKSWRIANFSFNKNLSGTASVIV